MNPADCPDSNTLNEFASGTLDGTRRADILVHLDTCVDCRRAAALAASDPGAEEQRSTLRSGDHFAGYVILDLLGAGAMGIVYAARDEALQRNVALKLVRPSTADDPSDTSAHERLLAEAKAAAALSHPNVVVVHEVGTFEEQVFIAMELVEAGTIADWLADAPRTVGEIVAMFAAAGEGLAAAHDAGLVHRDFKPDNVLVGRDGRPRVADFGVARRAGGPAGPELETSGTSPLAGTISRAGTAALVGTPNYMAPEQWRGEVADARADQFAFGVSLYECLYGRRAFNQREDRPLERDWTAPPMPRTARAGRVSASVRHALGRSMRPAPGERFPDMHAFLQELAPRTGSTARRAPTAVLVSLAGLAVLGGLGSWIHRSSPDAARAADSVRATVEAASAVRLMDLPTPSSDVTEAKGEYVAGVQALRDGSVLPGLRHLTRAVELDASMAAAHLRLAVYGRDVSLPISASRSFGAARELRSLLTPRDQTLLAALEPSFLAVPPDPDETARRLAALAARSPADVELQYLVAERERDPAAQIALLRHVLDLDPAFALALWRKGALELSLSSFETAVDTLERCVSVSPSSTACLTVLSLVDEELGRCKEMDRHARVLAKVSPSARTHDLVARALLANGAPVLAVREALERKWSAASDDDERTVYQNVDETNLAILAGDFATAERLERAAAERIEHSANEDDHKNTTVPLVALYGEMGRALDAGRIADQYLRARAGWESVGGWAPVPFMLAAAVHAGIRAEGDRRKARADWLAQWDSMDTPLKGEAWVLGYATPATTAAEAREALDAAPQPLPRAHTNQFHREGLGDPGKVLLLAGRVSDALPLLRTAAASCSALAAPLDHTWANLNLGSALDSAGDAAGACAAYRVVLQRWGAAKPRSTSAERARARFAALGCTAGE